eukprot:COSAG02_NODE_22075_length_764_cov_0.918797_1_plen_73_part_00
MPGQRTVLRRGRRSRRGADCCTVAMPGGFTRVHHVGSNEAEELKRQMIALRPFEVTFDGPIGMRVLDGEPRT